jgi:protein arginine N-methyltransferase 5
MNKKGFPVLSQTIQSAIGTLLQYKLQIIFTGKPRHASGILPYIQYIQHLKLKNASEMSEEEKFCSSYRDTLQSPLQPLMDNLESQTYETFERDPVKYDRYEAAIALALLDVAALKNTSTPSPPSPTSSSSSSSPVTNTSDQATPVIVTVVGAGRGPLVACALSASYSTGVPIRVYAVEKNQNAVITLRNRVLTERWTNVDVILCDMRMWRPPELADIMVSELLGSWGDNELSPECLDGAQVCLKPGGISIPSDYTSFVAPISSSKLWMSARELLGGNGLDTPFVVMFHNCFHLTAPKPCFKFVHPNPLPPHLIDNRRFTTLSFTAPLSATVHGFAGTFESVLYKDVMISIRPETHSPNMFSWFPLFLPLANPLRVNQGDTITINIWRCRSDRKVWYEWQLASPICGPIQNSNGKASWIGL